MRLPLFLMALTSSCAISPLRLPVRAHDPVGAAEGLIGRLLGAAYVGAFALEVIPSADGRDVFELAASGDGRPLLRGNSGVSLASALNFYLKYSVNASVSWGRGGSGNQLRSVPGPGSLPAPAPLRVVSPNAVRYLYNVCSFGYSTVWWGAEEWQQEIDRMALNGVTMPLAAVGQEWVLWRFLRSLGLSDEAFFAWAAGPAFLPWFRMNNVRPVYLSSSLLIAGNRCRAPPPRRCRPSLHSRRSPHPLFRHRCTSGAGRSTPSGSSRSAACSAASSPPCAPSA